MLDNDTDYVIHVARQISTNLRRPDPAKLIDLTSAPLVTKHGTSLHALFPPSMFTLM